MGISLDFDPKKQKNHLLIVKANMNFRGLANIYGHDRREVIEAVIVNIIFVLHENNKQE